MNPHEKFSAEEKKHLSFLGSALSRPNTEEEEQLEKMLEAEEKGQYRPKKRHSDGK